MAAGFSVISIGTYSFLPGFEKVIRKILEKETNNINLSDDAISRFMAEAHSENYWKRFSGFRKEFIRIHTILENKLLPLPYSYKYRQYKDQVICHFLLSTNFFDNQITTRKINYVAFYNPYKMACRNPFSNLHHPI